MVLHGSQDLHVEDNDEDKGDEDTEDRRQEQEGFVKRAVVAEDTRGGKQSDRYVTTVASR